MTQENSEQACPKCHGTGVYSTGEGTYAFCDCAAGHGATQHANAYGPMPPVEPSQPASEPVKLTHLHPPDPRDFGYGACADCAAARSASEPGWAESRKSEITEMAQHATEQLQGLMRKVTAARPAGAAPAGEWHRIGTKVYRPNWQAAYAFECVTEAQAEWAVRLLNTRTEMQQELDAALAAERERAERAERERDEWLAKWRDCWNRMHELEAEVQSKQRDLVAAGKGWEQALIEKAAAERAREEAEASRDNWFEQYHNAMLKVDAAERELATLRAKAAFTDEAVEEVRRLFCKWHTYPLNEKGFHLVDGFPYACVAKDHGLVARYAELTTTDNPPEGGV